MEAVVPMIIMLAIVVLSGASMWIIFTKANEPGWACLVPIYNTIVLLKIAGKPVWWFFILPLGIPSIFVAISLAKSFGKGAGFGVGISFLPLVFVPILAFGDSKYQGPAG